MKRGLDFTGPERMPVDCLLGQEISGICWYEGTRLCFLGSDGQPLFIVVASMIYGPNGNFLDTDNVAYPVTFTR